VPFRVPRNVFGRQCASVEQHIRKRVVARELMDLPVVQQVGPGVPHVRQDPGPSPDPQGRERRPHPVQPPGLGLVIHGAVGREDRLAQHGPDIGDPPRALPFPNHLHEGLERDAAGELTRNVPSHSICHGEQPQVGECKDRVLVVGADAPHVRRQCEANPHGSGSSPAISLRTRLY
jgi:hypothetical protein